MSRDENELKSITNEETTFSIIETGVLRRQSSCSNGQWTSRSRTKLNISLNGNHENNHLVARGLVLIIVISRVMVV